MRTRFDEQLSMLNRELIDMGALCEEAIAVCAKAMESGSAEEAARVRPIEARIDQKERDIETLCMKLLLQQQPVARDLRHISAALKMITDMERIGDQACDIADIVGFLGQYGKAYTELVADMARDVVSMVTESVEAYVRRDVVIAKAVISADDKVDERFSRIKADLIERVARAPEDGEFVLDLLMIAKYFERIGDHATNIAEWVEFSVTGRYKGGEIL